MRAFVIVIDSFGIGALPDADAYGDGGSNTALHIAEKIPGSKWPVLQQLGLGNASSLLSVTLPGCESIDSPLGSYGVMDEKSPGKDTTTGHWEIAGIVLEKPFYTFPQEYPSFPEGFVEAFQRQTGRKIIGNKAASGIEIIQELGDRHVQSGDLICYTSADSVFQIAAHEDIVPLPELYMCCSIARTLLDSLGVARVIARPFTGNSGSYTRTKNRKDFSIELPSESILEYLQKYNVKTIGVGKIGNIFNERGLTRNFPEKGNPACIAKTLELLSEDHDNDEFIFVNLVDTDMIYGHRRDPEGYFEAVTTIDSALGTFISRSSETDLLIITADHGCDPVFKGSDHTREYIPLLVYRKGKPGTNLGIRSSHADIAESLADYFNIPLPAMGTSFLR